MVNVSSQRSSEDNSLTKLNQDPKPPQRRKSLPLVKVPRPRWVLHIQAQVWRFLMGIGMYLHRLAPPIPPRPTFTRSIPAKLSGKPGLITLYFYTPLEYQTQRRLYKDKPLETEEEFSISRRRSVIGQVGESIKRKSGVQRRWGAYPVIINFHGGGFTLGTASDDARWCGTVVDELNAVVVAVDYRLAPEHPFPTAVEDGVDAVVWIHQHAAELGLDTKKIVISGFSSGGNMAVTVPLRLHDEITGFAREGTDTDINPSAGLTTSEDSAASSSSHVARPQGGKSRKTDVKITASPAQDLADIKIRAIVSWYPILDYTRTREERRALCIRQDHALPPIFTDLFDESYIHPSTNVAMDSPYLSPAVAPDALLRDGLPQDIIMYTCEWDMLLDEGQKFHTRLVSPPLNKQVFYKMVDGVPHGWDKSPNPWKPRLGVKEHYVRACKELKHVFNPQEHAERKADEGPLASIRRSIQFAR